MSKSGNLLSRSIPLWLQNSVSALIGSDCYVSLVENLELSNVECIKITISKGLGIAIVVGGSIVKIPQLILILRARSAKGLSLPAYALETLAYAISTAYSNRKNYPFSTYGENIFLTIQNVVITLLIIHFGSFGRSLKGGIDVVKLGTSAIAMLASAYFLYAMPISSLQGLQLATVPLSVASKLPQIAQNYRDRSTGQLSTFAVASQILGCIARVFTTSTEVGDPLVMAGFVVALILNIVLGVQIWMYWGQGLDEPVAARERTTLAAPLQEKPPVVPTQSLPQGRRWARKVD